MQTVLKSIPHRPPFLFVDEVVEQRETGITCRRKFRKDENFYAGHYPGNPITPGVLLCESVFQAAGIFLSSKFSTEERVPVLCRIENARFKNMVFPEDDVIIDVTFNEKLQGFYFLTGKVLCKGKTVLSIKFTLALVEQEQPQEQPH
jgi:3-hydroxyacyl-[acyl-carrier-protein] dehydratase